MKSYADTKRHAKSAPFKVGDALLVKQHKTNKLSTPFDSQPYKITKINGSMITAKRVDKSTTRKSSFFKLIRLHDPDSEDDFTTETFIAHSKPSRTSSILCAKVIYTEKGIIIPLLHRIIHTCVNII